MPQSDPDTNPVKQSILLDTCIVEYLANRHSGNEYANYLHNIVQRGFELAISEITIFEMLQGASEIKEKELLGWLAIFKRYAITSQTLVAAAQLQTLYAMEHVIYSQIAVGDKIIAATSVLTGSLIMTANANDFPRPYFVEAERQAITFSYKGTQRMYFTYILTPDTNGINIRFGSRPKS